MINKFLFLTFFLFATAMAGPMLEISSEEGLNDYIIKSEFSGVILVAKDSNILMKRAFGYKNLENKIPLTTEDKFQIGSITKQFVSAALLKLQEEGRVSLEDSISKYLPEFSIFKDIKIRNILNHSSGIPNYTGIEEIWENYDVNKTYTLDDLIAFIINYPLDFDPKTNWNYSNSGYIIAGKIIEIITGQTWDQYIDDNFLTPLQMENTGYQENFENVSDVTGYISEKRELKPFKYNLSWALSAGALYSTVEDLLKWTSIYEDSNLLGKNSKFEMQTPFLEYYGLGIFIKPYKDDIRINHGGSTISFNSSLDYLKNSKLKIITLDNVHGKTEVSNLLLNFYVDGKTTALKLDSYPLSIEDYQQYIGTYVDEGYEVEIFTENDQLFLKPNDGQRAYKIYANDKDSFNLEGFAGEEFIRNEAGKIIGLKHYQNGGVSYFSKKAI